MGTMMTSYKVINPSSKEITATDDKGRRKMSHKKRFSVDVVPTLKQNNMIKTWKAQ